MYAQTSGKYNFTLRPYALKLPTNYDPNKPYAVTFGGGGCGGSAQGFAGGPSGGFDFAPNGTVISIGLSYIATCFSDGGPDIGNRPDTPEVPYFRAVMADIEAKYCIDLSQVFVAGFSSGAWEAFTLGCAAADLIRGIGTDEGGMRAVRPPCTGPVAAFLVAGTADTENPIGPLAPSDGAYTRLGSPGSGPGRDDILTRNGCTGTTTAAWDSAFPACVKYTGCPASYPVVWCALPNVGHNDSTYNGINYSPGGMWKLLGSLPAP
jgi:poly(3-hydroxybutyrate) depolymerase